MAPSVRKISSFKERRKVLVRRIFMVKKSAEAWLKKPIGSLG